MPKPIDGINGSGMHVHQSFGILDEKGNAFVDEDDPYGLSPIAKQFIAGQLPHARGMCARDRAAGQLLHAAWCPASRRRSTSPGRGPTARR